jgi:hypothetical protein
VADGEAGGELVGDGEVGEGGAGEAFLVGADEVFADVGHAGEGVEVRADLFGLAAFEEFKGRAVVALADVQGGEARVGEVVDEFGGGHAGIVPRGSCGGKGGVCMTTKLRTNVVDVVEK